MTEYLGPPRRRRPFTPEPAEPDHGDDVSSVPREPGDRRLADPDVPLDRVTRAGTVRWTAEQRRANHLEDGPAPSLDLPPDPRDMAAAADDLADVDDLVRQVPRG